jgi:hypothetical protein
MATAAAPRASPPVLLPLLVSSGVFVAVFAALGAVLVGDASFGLWRWRGPLQLPSLGAGGRVFSLEELRQFDGSDPSKPIYLSIKCVLRACACCLFAARALTRVRAVPLRADVHVSLLLADTASST